MAMSAMCSLECEANRLLEQSRNSPICEEKTRIIGKVDEIYKMQDLLLRDKSTPEYACIADPLETADFIRYQSVHSVDAVNLGHKIRKDGVLYNPKELKELKELGRIDLLMQEMDRLNEVVINSRQI